MNDNIVDLKKVAESKAKEPQASTFNIVARNPETVFTQTGFLGLTGEYVLVGPGDGTTVFALPYERLVEVTKRDTTEASAS